MTDPNKVTVDRHIVDKASELAPSPIPDVAALSLADLRAALSAGWQDFRRAPMFGLFFSAVYVLIGFGFVLFGAVTVLWTFAFSLAFPLFAPFAAVGLYEVSRRLEGGAAMDWYQVLGVVAAERKRQIPWIGRDHRDLCPVLVLPCPYDLCALHGALGDDQCLQFVRDISHPQRYDDDRG